MGRIRDERRAARLVEAHGALDQDEVSIANHVRQLNSVREGCLHLLGDATNEPAVFEDQPVALVFVGHATTTSRFAARFRAIFACARFDCGVSPVDAQAPGTL